jgi:outer membrane protein assembly factor BamB
MTLNTHTGNLVWQQNNPPADTATCSEEVVFSSGVPRDSILAYDITTGEKLWSGTEPRKSFHIDQGELFIGGTVLDADT